MADPTEPMAGYTPVTPTEGHQLDHEDFEREKTSEMSFGEVEQLLLTSHSIQEVEESCVKAERWFHIKICLCVHLISCKLCCCAFFFFVCVPFLFSPGLMPRRNYDVVDGQREDDDVFYGDAWNRISVEAKYFSEGFPTEWYFIIDEGSEDWENNGTHVYIPFQRKGKHTTRVQSRYLALFHDEDNLEFGVANWRIDYNKAAAISPDISWGVAEKRLAYHRDKLERTSSHRIEEIRQNRWQITHWFASNMAPFRRLLLTIFFASNQLGSQIMTLGGMTRAQHAPIKEFALADNGEPMGVLKRNMSNLQDMTLDTFAHAEASGMDFQKPLFSYISCYHFADQFGGTVSDHHGVFIPLGKKITSFQGAIAMAPLESFDLYSGITVVRQSAETKKYEFYFASAIHSHFGDPHGTSTEAPFQPKLTIGPADGSRANLPLLKRHQTVQPSVLRYGLWTVIQWIPDDYRYLHTDFSEACPAAVLNDMHGGFRSDSKRSKDFEEFTTGEPSFMQKVKFLTTGTNYAKCILNYIVPATHNSAWGLYAVSGAFHSLMEVPLDMLMINMGSRDWNKITPW